ncbi:MAG: restriction endonuclease [Theionarchaea archaeon]|nr:restriction endonuclease [Theionarchaea archaeon]
MSPKKTGGMLLVILLVYGVIEGSSGVPLAGNGDPLYNHTIESNQYDPYVYGDLIVWTDDRNGDLDIYLYNPSEPLTDGVQITTDKSDQQQPAVYGERNEYVVVWTDMRNGNENIYGYHKCLEECRRDEISMGEFQITEDPEKQSNPALFEDIVVWQDYRNGNWDIYGYDLRTKKPFQITSDLDHQYNPQIFGYEVSKKPKIYSYIVIWEDERNGNKDIYRCRLTEGENDIVVEKEFNITENPFDQQNPAIFGNIIVWQDSRNGNEDIYWYNCRTEEEFAIGRTQGDQKNPKIHGEIVIWHDYRNGNLDIYGYRISTGEDFPLAKDLNDLTEPALYGNTVLLTDNRNGNKDIYLYDLFNIVPFNEFPVIIWIDRGYSGEYFIGEKIIVYWRAREETEFSLELRDNYRNSLGSFCKRCQVKVESLPLEEEDGYGKRLVCAEILGHSVECEFYVVEKEAPVEVTVRDQDKEPIPDAEVLLDGVSQGYTDNTGKFPIDTVEFGEHVVTVKVDDDRKERQINITSRDKQLEEFDFEIEKVSPVKTASLEVTVKDQDGVPISGAEVLLDGMSQGTTDNTGKLTKDTVEFGEHVAIVRVGDIEKDEIINITSTEKQLVEFVFEAKKELPIPVPIIILLIVAVIITGVFIVMRRPKKPEEKKEPEKRKPEKKIPEKKIPEEKPQKDIPPKIPEKELPPRQPIPPEKPNYEEFKRMWDNVKGSEDTKEKGKLLEDFFEKLLEDSNCFNVVGRDIRSEFEEIDLVSSHDLQGIFKKVDPIILIECKNWSKKAGKNELVSFYDKILNRRPHSNLGIFVSVKGFKRTVNDFLKSKAESDIKVVLISGDDIDNMFAMNQDIVTLIEEKFKRNIILMRE